MGAAVSVQQQTQIVQDSSSPTPDPNVPLPFPKHGVHLSFANQFIAECGGRDVLEGLTTTEVNDQFVKPATFATQSSYCDMLISQHHAAVGMATVFISHAWKYHFLDVVDALNYHFKDEPDIIIWFDLFSNNQHKAVDLDFHWWCNTFKLAIQMFGRTVMVLAPWSNPIPLTRGWCLFELYCTAVSDDCKFEVAMSQTHQTHFFEDMATDGAAAIDKMLATINAEMSECWKAEDRERIFHAVRNSVGFAGINAMVFEQLREWVVAVTVRAIEQETDATKLLGLKSTLGKLYEGQGKYDLVEPLFVECLAMRLEEEDARRQQEKIVPSQPRKLRTQEERNRMAMEKAKIGYEKEKRKLDHNLGLSATTQHPQHNSSLSQKFTAPAMTPEPQMSYLDQVKAARARVEQGQAVLAGLKP